MEGELADDEKVAVEVIHRAVHLARVIREHAQTEDFLRQPCAIRRGVILGDAEEDEQAGADFAGEAVGGFHTGRGNTLDDSTHGYRLRPRRAAQVLMERRNQKVTCGSTSAS